MIKLGTKEILTKDYSNDEDSERMRSIIIEINKRRRELLEKDKSLLKKCLQRNATMMPQETPKLRLFKHFKYLDFNLYIFSVLTNYKFQI